MSRVSKQIGWPFAVALLCSLGAADGSASETKPWIAAGHSDARIVLTASDAVTREAGEALCRYVTQATGVTLPVETERTEGVPTFLVGWGEAARKVGQGLQEDGFVWQTPDARTVIVGGPGRGTLYGVHAFLEEHVGIRRYTPTVEHVPSHDAFTPPVLDERREPAFPVRWVHMPGADHDEWCDWHGVHPRSHRDAYWGMFVHTFEKLVPPETYFDAHPEYYSQLRGKRLPNMQLCLTNEDVFQIVVKELGRRIAKHPEAKAWSVSQNDRHGACECANCRALVEKHGSESGPLLAFVNRVAAAFPDQTISTLAYSYTRRAPKGLKPAPNVNICLCSIECDRATPLAGSRENADFVRDIREWTALTDNVMIWDYVVQFSNYVSPFPNFHVLQPNLQLFRDHGCRIMFQQGSGGVRSDLHELKQYVIAKLLWNPDLEVEAIEKDFLEGYYGNAAPHMRRYLEFLRARLKESGARLGIYDSPNVEVETWLKPETLDLAEDVLADAAKASRYPWIRMRIAEARASLMYARLEQAKRFGSGTYGLFERALDGTPRVKPRFAMMLQDFARLCEAAGFETIHERMYPPHEYVRQTRRFFEEGMVSHLGVGLEATCEPAPNPKYPADGLATLTDGLRGTTSYFFNWLGWEATDARITLDLGAPKPVAGLRADFLQVVQSWIWLPMEVRWLVSADGTTWETVATLHSQADERSPDPFTERFACTFAARPVRYVRLEATGHKHCPTWHQGAGGDAWIFVDEVVVESGRASK